MTKTILLGITVASLIAVTALLGPAIADEMGFVDIKRGVTVVTEDDIKSVLYKLVDKVPLDGSEGAFGYMVF